LKKSKGKLYLEVNDNENTVYQNLVKEIKQRLQSNTVLFLRSENKRTGIYISVVEYLLSICKALGSIPSTKGKEREGERREKKEGRNEGRKVSCKSND
jgi:hypothetical protein